MWPKTENKMKPEWDGPGSFWQKPKNAGQNKITIKRGYFPVFSGLFLLFSGPEEHSACLEHCNTGKKPRLMAVHQTALQTNQAHESGQIFIFGPLVEYGGHFSRYVGFFFRDTK